MGMGIIYGLKVNLSVAIVSMVNHTAIEILAREQHAIEGAEMAESMEIEDCSDGGSSNGSVEVILNLQFVILETYDVFVLFFYYRMVRLCGQVTFKVLC